MERHKPRVLLVAAVVWAIALHLSLVGPFFLAAGQSDPGFRSSIPASTIWWGLVASLAVAVPLTFFAVRSRRLFAVIVAVGLCLLVQFHWLAWNVGILDGQALDFAPYRTHAIAELGAFTVLLIVAALWPSFVIRVAAVPIVAIVAATGLYALATSPAAPWNDGPSTPASVLVDGTGRGVLTLSPSPAIVLMLDTLQGDVLQRILESDESLRNAFRGFTLFTDSVGVFPFTELSVLALQSGDAFDPDEESVPEYRKRIPPQMLWEELARRDVRSSILSLTGRDQFLDTVSAACRQTGLLYDLFVLRQLPMSLKPGFYDDGHLQFARRCRGSYTNESLRDLAVLNELIARTTTASADGTSFAFVHLWGSHLPATVTADCALRPEPSNALDNVMGQATCILSSVGRYFDALRATGVFEQAMIFVVADHGTRSGFVTPSEGLGPAPAYVMSSAHPAIAFHAPGDTAPFRAAASPVSLMDVYPTVMRHFGVEVSTTGRDVRDIDERAERERHFTSFRRAKDIFLPRFSPAERYIVRGDVRNPASWTRGVPSISSDAVLDRVVFASEEGAEVLGQGWSIDVAEQAAVWLLSSPATIAGRLPQARSIRLTLELLNPHADQVVTIGLNGRRIGQWDQPTATDWIERSLVFSPTAEERAGTIRLEFGASRIARVPASERELGIAVRLLTLDSLQ